MQPPSYPYPEKPRSKMKLVVIAVIVLLLAGGGWYVGKRMMGGVAAPQMGGGLPVEIATVTPRTLDITIDSVGTLAANESLILRPETEGRITAIKFVEGQPLKKGSVLFQLDDRLVRAEVKQAEANLQLARLNYDRFQTLSKTGAATKQKFDESRANLGVAQANADMAKTNLAYTQIVAPFDGVVGLRKVSPGDYVTKGQELANFVSYDPMKVDFSIPETQANVLKANQQIDITVEAIPGKKFTGNVYALDPQLDVSGRAVSLRATIPNSEMELKPGYFARVLLTVERRENALVIPESAIVPQGDSKNVYKVEEDGTANLVPVTIGKRIDGQVEVTQGLTAGDRVVTSGQIKMHPGMKVMDLAVLKAAAAAAEEPKKEEVPAAAPAPLPEPTPAPEPESAPDAAPDATQVPPPAQPAMTPDVDTGEDTVDLPHPDEGEGAQEENAQ